MVVSISTRKCTIQYFHLAEAVRGPLTTRTFSRSDSNKLAQRYLGF